MNIEELRASIARGEIENKKRTTEQWIEIHTRLFELTSDAYKQCPGVPFCLPFPATSSEIWINWMMNKYDFYIEYTDWFGSKCLLSYTAPTASLYLSKGRATRFLVFPKGILQEEIEFFYPKRKIYC